VREMMGILRELATWSHTTKIQWLIEWRSVTNGRIMRSRAIVQICLQLNQMNVECQTTLILILVVYDALLAEQYWVGGSKFTPILQSVSRHKSNEVRKKHARFSSLLSVPLVLDWHVGFILIRSLRKVLQD
jgi:hypothetical protein